MAIDEVYQINTNSPDETPTLKKALSSIAEQAVGSQYIDTLPTDPSTIKVPAGKMVIYDNGSGTLRLYVKTGKGNVGYVTLTSL